MLNFCNDLFNSVKRGVIRPAFSRLLKKSIPNSFIIDPFDFADGEDKGEVVGVVHSHPQNVLEFSEADIVSCNSIQIPFYLVCPDLDKMIVIQPSDIDA